MSSLYTCNNIGGVGEKEGYISMEAGGNISCKSEVLSRPIFDGSGSDTSKIKLLWLQLRLRLLVNCKAANYEFLTTKKKLFSSLIQNYRMYMFDFRNNFLYQGRKQGFGSAFFCGSGSWGFRGRGVGVKGKNDFF